MKKLLYFLIFSSLLIAGCSKSNDDNPKPDDHGNQTSSSITWNIKVSYNSDLSKFNKHAVSMEINFINPADGHKITVDFGKWQLNSTKSLTIKGDTATIILKAGKGELHYHGYLCFFNGIQNECYSTYFDGYPESGEAFKVPVKQINNLNFTLKIRK